MYVCMRGHVSPQKLSKQFHMFRCDVIITHAECDRFLTPDRIQTAFPQLEADVVPWFRCDIISDC